jgi:hypothetical protein
VTPRAKTVAVGALFWFAFAPVAILGLLLLPVGILLYALGNDNIRERVFQVGRAADQFDNALAARTQTSRRIGRLLTS